MYLIGLALVGLAFEKVQRWQWNRLLLQLEEVQSDHPQRTKFTSHTACFTTERCVQLLDITYLPFFALS